MTLDFKEERDRDFMEAYRDVIGRHGANARFLRKEVLLHETVFHPARRFYVSEEQAIRVVGRLLKGQAVFFKNRVKAEMYGEIVRRLNEGNEAGLPLRERIIEVIYGEAPRFYIGLESAFILFYGLIRER